MEANEAVKYRTEAELEVNCIIINRILGSPDPTHHQPASAVCKQDYFVIPSHLPNKKGGSLGVM